MVVEVEDQCLSMSVTSHSKPKEWFLAFFPYGDAAKYHNCLVEDGFDSVKAMRKYLREEDLSFMKKGHKRIVMGELSEREEP